MDPHGALGEQPAATAKSSASAVGGTISAEATVRGLAAGSASASGDAISAAARASGYVAEGAAYQVTVDVKVNPLDMAGDGGAGDQCPVPPKARPEQGRQVDEKGKGKGGAIVDAPWMDPEFQRPPFRASGVWNTSYLAKGWLIRVHGRARGRLFHPIRGSAPVGPEALGAQRTTVRFLDNGTVDCQADDFRGKTKTEDNVKWRGIIPL